MARLARSIANCAGAAGWRGNLPVRSLSFGTPASTFHSGACALLLLPMLYPTRRRPRSCGPLVFPFSASPRPRVSASFSNRPRPEDVAFGLPPEGGRDTYRRPRWGRCNQENTVGCLFMVSRQQEPFAFPAAPTFRPTIVLSHGRPLRGRRASPGSGTCQSRRTGRAYQGRTAVGRGFRAN